MEKKIKGKSESPFRAGYSAFASVHMVLFLMPLRPRQEAEDVEGAPLMCTY